MGMKKNLFKGELWTPLWAASPRMRVWLSIEGELRNLRGDIVGAFRDALAVSLNFILQKRKEKRI
jgi:hypothetical protein